MRRTWAAVCGVLVLLAGLSFGTRVFAEPPQTPQAALERLFTSDHVSADWFAPSFLSQVPASQVETIIGQIKATLGTYQRVVPEANKYRVIFSQGEDLASIVLDETGHITGLFFEAPQLRAKSVESAVDAIKQLPGRVSVFVTRNGVDRAAVDADRAQAVGSTFKLAILNALLRKIGSGGATWRTVLKLETSDKSLPSGTLRNWPPGAPLTVYSVAAFMISQSDNTAADMLLRYTGRSNVEVFGGRNRPFLTTREAFVLKDPKNAALLKRYLAADEAGRRALLPEIDRLPLPDVSVFGPQPQAPEVEWFFSTRQLCELMRPIQALPIMSINPGVAELSDWKRVSYKGGSEPGVLNMTTWLEAKDGTSYCVSATWNDDKALDEVKFFGLYKSLLASLAT